jgi:hypothetical protein
MLLGPNAWVWVLEAHHQLGIIRNLVGSWDLRSRGDALAILAANLAEEADAFAGQVEQVADVCSAV